MDYLTQLPDLHPIGRRMFMDDKKKDPEPEEEEETNDDEDETEDKDE